MKKNLVGIMIVAVVLLLCGCWDQQLMKNERNVSIGGMDQGAKGMLRATVSIRDITITESGSKDTSEVHSVLAKSTQHARDLLNEEVSGGYSAAKMRVLLFGEEMVRNHDILPFLDVYYRDPRSPLNARVAIVRGKAEDMVGLKQIGSKTVGLYIDNLLNSMEKAAVTPRVTIQTLHPLDRGFDFSLPYLIINKGMPNVHGIALFKGINMTESLNLDESKLYLLLSGSKNKNLNLTLKTLDNVNSKSKSYNYVTVEVKKAEHKLRVTVSDDQQISVKLRLKLRVNVMEDPSDHLYKMSVMHDLERLLSEKLMEDSKAVVKKMQMAGHDGFGIARRLMSFHPTLWKQLDWDKEYPKIVFDTKVTLQIVNTGITE